MQVVHIDKKISKAISLVSQSEIYQGKLFALMCAIWVQLAFSALINPVVFTNPLLKCDGKVTT